VSLLHVHLVFVTKYRRRVFDHTILTTCAAVRRQICDDLGAELLEFKGEADHVHLLVRCPPTVPISELVRRLKSASARRMRADYTGACNRARMHRHFSTPAHFAVPAEGTHPCR
jgi:putative transposase